MTDRVVNPDPIERAAMQAAEREARAELIAEGERDALAEAFLIAEHDNDWYIGDASLKDWERAYQYVDEREARG